MDLPTYDCTDLIWIGWMGWGGWGWDGNIPWTCAHTTIRIDLDRLDGLGGLGGVG